MAAGTGLLLMACGTGSGTYDATTPHSESPTAPPAQPSLSPVLTNAGSPLMIPTYDGSGQAVHPDVVEFRAPWHGYSYWMAMTPYPYGDDRRENPSIVVSNDGAMWRVPPELANPLVPAPTCDHNSDPDLVYRPDVDELYLFYTVQQRSVRCSSYNRNELRLIRSHDGVRWSAAETVLSWDLAKAPLYLSPGVVYRDGSFELWMAGNGGVVHATSRDGFVWSPVAPVRIDAKPWHLDVEFDEARSAYWMVYVDSPRPGSKLRLATSSDGLSWAVYPAPLLVPGRAWDDNRIYRATFVEGSGTFRVWYSAESRLGQWHIGYAEAASVALSP